MACSAGAEMGLAAGGKMRQKIYPDEHGIDTWDQESSARSYVHIVNSMMFREITGLEPPPTPITAKHYTDYGLPWFDLYDEKRGDVEPSSTLAGVKSTSEADAEKGFAPHQDDTSVEIDAQQVIGLKGATTSPPGQENEAAASLLSDPERPEVGVWSVVGGTQASEGPGGPTEIVRTTESDPESGREENRGKTQGKESSTGCKTRSAQGGQEQAQGKSGPRPENICLPGRRRAI